ncbi:uncharacterized protein Tco025E_01219 [Trypanosoma conorhini]|uniref:Guanine nucleotide-binding protein-like 3 N-terminal domain-containing protein n=1 Tax=Trypanosoma conorhini TaxID=83891 RepID=A0A422Q916_9TRYP|nr:uncharacterized protein Tco025E_01219 [Trypanosoma conorhini]RNF26472.1 hypothetical protein Tco025E_01219 [Trypanosoma conorhini]
MPKVRSGPSKRMTSRQRHKIERKKREHKRDLRRAAKSLKKSGLGPKRTKKTRELAKLALKVSNAHPDKEAILQRVLQAREDARVERAKRAEKPSAEEDDARGHVESASELAHTAPILRKIKKALTYIPVRESNNFSYQFNKALAELVFPPPGSWMELPSAAYVITLDARCAVQCIPWALLDAIVQEANVYNKNGGVRKILLLFAITKIDLVSVPAVVTQISLLANALCERYVNRTDSEESLKLSDAIRVAFCPVSKIFDKTIRHVIRILRQFLSSEQCSQSNPYCNLEGKLCSFVIGLPNTGRRTLSRSLLQYGTDSGVSLVPVSAAQLQVMASKDENKEDMKFKLAFPNAKEITLLQFPEDAVLLRELSSVSGGNVVFKPFSFIERMTSPEVIGCMLFEAAIDKVALAQGFCQPGEGFIPSPDEEQNIKMAQRFFRGLGHTVRREKGFYVSPLFVSNAGTMGKLSSSSLTASVGFTSRQQSTQTTLLDASFSNATPNKLVRISSVVTPSHGKRKSNMSVQRMDSHNALKLGARTFVREICQGKNIPWAVMRPPTKKCVTKAEVEAASVIFDISLSLGKRLGMLETRQGPTAHFASLLDHVASLLKQYLMFLPNNVVEFDPDCIIAPIHDLYATENANEEEEADEMERGDGSEGSYDDAEEEEEDETEEEEEDDSD